MQISAAVRFNRINRTDEGIKHLLRWCRCTVVSNGRLSDGEAFFSHDDLCCFCHGWHGLNMCSLEDQDGYLSQN